MYKHPLHYKKEDIDQVMNKNILIDVCDMNKDEIKETVEGVIENCSLACNYPHLPGSLTVITSNGETRTLSLFEIIRFRDI